MILTGRSFFPAVLLAVALACAPWAAIAQLPSLKPAKEKPADTLEAETPEQARKRLAQWISEWRTLSESPATTPPGIAANEAADRRSDLLMGIFTAENSLRSLDAAIILQQSLDQAKKANAAWQGFDQPGPYSFVLHDELRRQQEGIATRLSAYESAVAMLERELSNRLDDIKKAEESLRRAREAAERAAPAEVEAARWRAEALQLRVRALGSSAGMLQLSRENTRLRISTASQEAELLKRKVAALGGVTAFPEADLAHLEKSTADRRKEIAAELAAIEKSQRDAISARQKALVAAEALRAKEPDLTDDEKAKLKDAEAKLKTRDAELESLANRAEITGARLRFLGEYLDAQKSRQTLLTSGSAAERMEALAALEAQLARASAFDSLVDVRRNATLSAIQEQEAKLDAMEPDSPLRAAAERLQATLRADLDAVERFGQDISSLDLDIGRWLKDSREIDKSMTWSERFSSFGSRLAKRAKDIRDFEVYEYEAKTEIEGQVIPVKRGLTLGWLIGALLFFYLAYRAGSALLKRAFRRLVAKGRVEKGQADTLRRWTRIAMGIVLALVTLHLLKIPLTAFAFLGGALAIGVGFGTQTLFKNFISGLIVLAERKVRVGDILEVDGVAGTVTTIDTRSSTVRSFDGVEMILPNSLLLENKVINWTHGTSIVRRVVRIGVAYGSPTRMVSTILSECAAEHGVIAKTPEPQVVLEDFGADALVFALYFWIDLRGKTGASVVASDLRFMIERRLNEAGIAFPQREMHLATEKPIQVSLGESGTDGA